MLPTLNPPSSARSAAIADWLELVTVLTDRRVMSPAKGMQFLDRFGGAADDQDVALSFAVLHERSLRGLAYYPFGFSRLGIERNRETDPTAYLFLLILAMATDGAVTLRDAAKGSVLFERLTRAAVETLFGPGAAAVRFGHPPEPERPGNFDDAVRWLAGKLNARPRALSGAAIRRADGGIDVVAWRAFGDERTNGPIAAVQVTFESDLRGKSLEIAGNELDRWIEIARPVPVLAVPVDGMDDPDLYVELSSRVVVLDRWRLLKSLEDAEYVPTSEICGWVGDQLAGLEV
jgi:hypothetical protein